MAILCTVFRGSQVESIHVVYAVVVDENGEIIYSTGEPDYITCVRSSLKPFQAAASFKAGAVEAAGFDLKEQALMCASHNGEAAHVETAMSMMKKLGYGPEFYECGHHEPYDPDATIELHKSGKEATPFHNNCSGKHAGMLSLVRHLGVDPTGYIKIEHPVQQAIFKGLREYTGKDEFPLGIDGCTAPVPFLPLSDLARLYQKLASGNYPDLNGPFKAMTTYPYIMSGTKRFDADFNAALNGRGVTKIGGEAVRGIGIRQADGKAVGIALKVLDGNSRALPPATLAVLTKLNLLSEDETNKLSHYRSIKLTNHNKIHTGDIIATFQN